MGDSSITATSSGGFYSELRLMPWGGNRYTSGTTPTTFRYTGQREAEAGLYFYGARFYDPALGRFVSPDSVIPQGQGAQAWDRYAYVNNNPVRYIDPSGHGVDCGMGVDCPSPTQATISSATTTNSSTTSVMGEVDQSEDIGVSIGDVLSTIAAGADLAAYSINITQVGIIDGIGGIYILLSLFIPGSTITAVGEVLALDFAMNNNPLAWLENALGFGSLGFTAAADFAYGNTNLASASIGVDTLVAARSAVLGLIPEVNIDAAVSFYQLSYDFARADGRLPGGSVPINLNTFLGLLYNWPVSSP